MARPILIIGSGIAGLTAAEAARKQDPSADLVILSQDRHAPYYRLRICEVLDQPAMSGMLDLHPADWYTQNRIRLETGATVAAIDAEAHEAVLSDGGRLAYASLIICSGSRSFVPSISGAGRPNIHTLWSMQNALDLAAALEQASQAVVIGGGLLGLEAAYHIRRRGIAVTIVEKAPRLLANQLDQAGSAVLSARVREQDIAVVTAADIIELTGLTDDPASPVSGVQLADGEHFAADLVVICIGVRAATGFLAGSGLAVQRRILTDTRMQTSLADIYAAGDAAEPDGFWFGLWSSARLQGQVAGTNAAGGNARFDSTVPPYIINTMGTRVAVQGDQGLADVPQYELDVLLDEASGNYRKLIYRDGIFKGFMLVGNTFDFVKLQKQIGQPGRQAGQAL